MGKHMLWILIDSVRIIVFVILAIKRISKMLPLVPQQKASDAPHPKHTRSLAGRLAL